MPPRSSWCTAIHDHFRHDGWRGQRVVEHRIVFDTLRFHRSAMSATRISCAVTMSCAASTHRGRVTFVEVNPYTGAYIGFIRL